MPQSTDINDPNVFVLYRYQPSLVAAVIFIVCFLSTTSMHIFQASRRRTFYFIPLIIGGFFEWIGYVGRALAHSNENNLNIFIFQTLLLLLGPALFAASIYMVLGRLIRFTEGENLAPIRARWLTKIFVCGDVLSFLVQSGGGALMDKANTMTTGKRLVVTGLFLQIFFFGVFVITGGVFHYRIIRSPTQASTVNNWQKYMYTLYAASVLILIRSIFRVFEFSGGNDGVLMRSEVFLYLFDAVLMLGVMVSFNAVHPGSIIGRKSVGGAVELSDTTDGRDGYASDRK